MVVIIGGGVAGLCAAIELCKLGIYPTLIEAGSYPVHKVCGEFLSPESLPWLNALDIHPTLIHDIFLGIDTKHLSFLLKQPAGSLSHFTLDTALAEKAIQMGTELRTNVAVKHLSPYVIELSTGELLHPRAVVIATGRLPSLSQPPSYFKYMGIKAHFEGIELNHTLKMFCFNNAYLGVSPIENGKSNLACLASMKAVEKAGSPERFMNDLIEHNLQLKSLLSGGKNLFGEWMTAKIPFFGFKSTPDWSNTYFIGDAAMSVPPACGGGLTLAINSGIQAAKFVANGDYISFKKQLQKDNRELMRYAKGLHYLLMRPWLGKACLKICSIYPSLPEKIFQHSRSK